MNQIFNADSPIMRFLGRVADLLILNLVTLLCCLPIITIGPALTGMHYALWHLVRNEESYVTKMFFKSFKENFKQGVVLGLIFIFAAFVLGFDFRIVMGFNGTAKTILFVLLLVVTVVTICVALYAFPLLSRYVNSNKDTLRNALILSISYLPRTVAMLLIVVLWILICYYFIIRMAPIVILFGLTAPGYVCAMLYNGAFQMMDKALGVNGDAEAEEADPETIEGGTDAAGIAEPEVNSTEPDAIEDKAHDTNLTE